MIKKKLRNLQWSITTRVADNAMVNSMTCIPVVDNNVSARDLRTKTSMMVFVSRGDLLMADLGETDRIVVLSPRENLHNY